MSTSDACPACTVSQCLPAGQSGKCKQLQLLGRASSKHAAAVLHMTTSTPALGEVASTGLEQRDRLTTWLLPEQACQRCEADRGSQQGVPAAGGPTVLRQHSLQCCSCRYQGALPEGGSYQLHANRQPCSQDLACGSSQVHLQLCLLHASSITAANRLTDAKFAGCSPQLW